MPETTPELAWWVMTGAIAGLLSLITLLTASIAYFMKSGFDRIVLRLDQLQSDETTTAAAGIEHRAACEERHKALDERISKLTA